MERADIASIGHTGTDATGADIARRGSALEAWRRRRDGSSFAGDRSAVSTASSGPCARAHDGGCCDRLGRLTSSSARLSTALSVARRPSIRQAPARQSAETRARAPAPTRGCPLGSAARHRRAWCAGRHGGSRGSRRGWARRCRSDNRHFKQDVGCRKLRHLLRILGTMRPVLG